jgi:hypothetical protein
MKAPIEVLYVPWYRRRELWAHDHNGGEGKPVKLRRVKQGQFTGECECGAIITTALLQNEIRDPMECDPDLKAVPWPKGLGERVGQ